MARRICIVTGSRAEYGLLYWLIREVRDSSNLELQLVVTGMHLAPQYGETWRDIVADGFPISAKVESQLAGDSPAAITKSVGLGVIGFADAFERLAPDVVVVLGDRFEVLAAAQAAMLAGIAIAHIHGGEITEGAVDESIRHAITKMAQLHFVAAEPYRRRVIQMGEAPDRVFTVGAPGVDNLRRRPLLDRDALAGDLGLALTRPTFLVTYHPATLGGEEAVAGVAEVLAALDGFPEAAVIITGVNADAGNHAIAEALQDFARHRAGKAVYRASLGVVRYLSAMSHADVVIGNSSSGLIEAPAAGTPTVNIGMRQSGRLRAPSVVDCPAERAAIAAAIRCALDPGFRDTALGRDLPYGGGEASTRMAHILATVPLDGIVRKPFHARPRGVLP